MQTQYLYIAKITNKSTRSCPWSDVFSLPYRFKETLSFRRQFGVCVWVV